MIWVESWGVRRPEPVGGSKAPSTIIHYHYDAQSRRTTKKAGAGIATHYLYDGWNLIAEYTGTVLEKTYTWGMDVSGSMQGAGGVGGLLSVDDQVDRYYPTYDGNGNVSEYLNATGAVAAHYEYDAFGNTTGSSGAKKDDFLHRFSTKPLDAETGLYYYDDDGAFVPYGPLWEPNEWVDHVTHSPLNRPDDNPTLRSILERESLGNNVYVNDVPGAGTQDDGQTKDFYRYLRFRITLVSHPDCDCEKSQAQVRARQELQILDGRKVSHSLEVF